MDDNPFDIEYFELLENLQVCNMFFLKGNREQNKITKCCVIKKIQLLQNLELNWIAGIVETD